MDLNLPSDNHNVYHKGVYKVLCKSVHIETKKDLTFAVEIYSESSTLKIIVSDERDPCFLCVLTLTRFSYDELKKQQGLLIDFDSFPAQFVRLLHSSVDGNMFLTLLQSENMHLTLDVVEHNEFKRLVHLSLTTGPASDADIKKNMAQSVLTLKKKISELLKKQTEEDNIHREKEQMLESKVKDLNVALCRMQDDKMRKESEHVEVIKREREKLEEERREWKKCAELHSQTQVGSIQDALNRKEKLLDEATLRCQQLQDSVLSLESQLIEKGQRIVNLEKQLHSTRMDVDTVRTQNAALDREYHDRDLNLQHARTKLMDAEKNLKDKSDLLREALDSLQSIKREKNVLEERVSAIESLSTKHKSEAQNTGEQLMKANQIISKLNNDLIEMREKLMCRTAIALEQEKVIEKHSLETESLVKKGREQSEEIKRLNTEFELASLDLEKHKRLVAEKEEIIKNNNTVIQWLHRKIDAVNPQDQMSTTTSRMTHNSTPFFHSSNANVTEKNILENNNDVISAYTAGMNFKSVPGRTSRPSTRSDESVTESDKDKYRLDPIYLEPTSTRSKSEDSTRHSSSKTEPSTSRSNKTTGKSVSSTQRSNISGHSKKSVQSFRKSDVNSNPLSPISAYFGRP